MRGLRETFPKLTSVGNSGQRDEAQWVPSDSHSQTGREEARALGRSNRVISGRQTFGDARKVLWFH